MNRRSSAFLVTSILGLAVLACDSGGMPDDGPATVAGTWLVRVVSSGSLLTDCRGVSPVPGPTSYSGLLGQAESAGTVMVDQIDDRFSIRPVVDAQPSGLTATFMGEGTVGGGTIAATIELELTDPGRPESDLQSESLRGVVDGPASLTLRAERWIVGTGGCTIEPPVDYRIVIQ